MMENHYITISSTNALKQSTSNTSSDFYTYLDNPIYTNGLPYEVGIADVIYHPLKNLFGYKPHDNLIRVETTAGSFARFMVVKTKDLSTDIFSFDQTMEVQRLPVRIRQKTINGQVHYSISQETSPYRDVVLSEDFRKVFGFELNTYRGQQQILAENSFNQLAYDKLPQKTKMSFDLVTNPQHTNIYVGEPNDLTVEDFQSALNEALINGRLLDLSFVHNEPDVIQLDTTGKTPYKLYPSERISEMLGTNETILTPGFISGKIDLFKDNKQILISTDILEPQVVYGKRRQLLRMILHDRSKPVQHLIFNPVYYCSLNRTDITSVQILLQNEEGNLIPFKDNFTIVLHIRSKL